MREWLSIKEAAEEVGVCRRTIYYWMDAGRIVWKRTAGGARRIERDSLWRAKEQSERRRGERGEADDAPSEPSTP